MKIPRFHKLVPNIKDKPDEIIIIFSWYEDVAEVLKDEKSVQKAMFLSGDFSDILIERHNALRLIALLKSYG